MRIPILLLVLLLFQTPALAATDISALRVDSTPTQSAKELVKQAALIVVGQISTVKEYPTSQQFQEGKLVNYVQTIRVEKRVKGSSGTNVRLLVAGVDPLPHPSNPLNLKYPGPFTEGTYLLFLRAVPGTEFYSLVGVWQGIYPVMEGKTIALRGLGYAEFNSLRVDDLAKAIRELDS